MKNKKKSLVLMAVAVFTLLLVVSGAAYAYFRARLGTGTGTSINATTSTTDSLSFAVGADIKIEADLDNFYEGHASLKGETTATATLLANNNTNSATARYNLFFIIDKNDFEYSTEDGQTELLMKVTDPNGNEVMDITGLKRVEGGFDITTRTGGFLVMADYDIAATPTETTKAQTWKLEVTFVNLDADQNINQGKTFNGKFYITKEQESTYELAEINNIEATPAYNTITANLSTIPGTEAIAKYYYAIEEDTSGIAFVSAGVSVARLSNNLAIKDSDFIESDQPTHTFTNLKPSTKYKVYSYAKDIYGVKSNVYETSITTGDYELASITNVTQSVTLNSITVTATAKGGSNAVSQYFFSKDDGATWSEGQDSNTYTFNDLLDTTEYKIKVKVIDTNDIYSTEYAKTIATTTYNNPSVTTVNADKTYNTISLTTTAAGGTNSVAKYYYKINNGNWSEAQTTNTYNITTGLTENTKYTIYVKVEDTIGRMSNEYSLDVTTNTYEIPSVTATTSVTTNSITINATGTNGDGTIAKYMYSKDGGSNWVTQNSTATSDSYTFSSLTPGATFQIRVKVVDSNNRESTIYSTSVTTEVKALANACTGKNMANCFAANYTLDENIYFHNESLENGAGDNSYRYAGANPDNYICFGSTEETCPVDNLYRIIGVFGNQVKLIKSTAYIDADYTTNSYGYSGYYWSGSSSRESSNSWSSSTLNTSTLNGSYLNGLGTTWNNKIATNTWNVGGMKTTYGYTNAKTAYDYELGANKYDTTYSAKIGLMYASEYYYATIPTYWAYSGGYNSSGESNDYRAATGSNWIYLGASEWIITPVKSNVFIQGRAPDAYYIEKTGYISSTGVDTSYDIRPTFYLNSGVALSGGSGTSTDPFRLEPEEINFKIGTIEYAAKEGMTWREWIASAYDHTYSTSTWGTNGSYVSAYVSASSSCGKTYTVKNSETNTNVPLDEEIINGFNYTASSGGMVCYD